MGFSFVLFCSIFLVSCFLSLLTFWYAELVWSLFRVSARSRGVKLHKSSQGCLSSEFIPHHSNQTSCLASAQNMIDGSQDKPVIKMPLVNINIADHLLQLQT
jgi:hypothetical protein